MKEKLAFTACFWGKSAVVCRALGDRPGPTVEQQFGAFATWTEAQGFAERLNEGLELSPVEARKIVTSATLEKASVRQAFELSQCNCDFPVGRQAVMSNRMGFVLAELELAITFCRMVRSRPDSPLIARMMRNSRNALFNALHFGLISDLCDYCAETIHPQVEKLRVALQQAFLPEESAKIAAAGTSGSGIG